MNVTSHDKLISFIVPVYNVEKYIETCIKSILNQDYQYFEVIIVDDGSSDNSCAIVDDLAKTDERLLVVHKVNGGVSQARNTGLSIARGEYILFIDGDDFIEPGYASFFVSLIERYKCDIAMNTNNFTSIDSLQVDYEYSYTIKAEKAIEYIYLGHIFVAVWNKIYRRSFLIENNINFNNDIWFGEGMLFNIECLQFTDKVAIGNRKLYHQVYNRASAMRSFNLESNYCGIRSLKLQKQLWRKKNKSIENAWTFHYRRFSFNILAGLIRSNIDQDYYEEVEDCKRILKSNINSLFCIDICIKQKTFYLLTALCPVSMAKYAVKREKHKYKNIE